MAPMRDRVLARRPYAGRTVRVTDSQCDGRRAQRRGAGPRLLCAGRQAAGRAHAALSLGGEGFLLGDAREGRGVDRGAPLERGRPVQPAAGRARLGELSKVLVLLLAGDRDLALDIGGAVPPQRGQPGQPGQPGPGGAADPLPAASPQAERPRLAASRRHRLVRAARRAALLEAGVVAWVVGGGAHARRELGPVLLEDALGLAREVRLQQQAEAREAHKVAAYTVKG
eukprot:scaffold39718_cov67-Phaeocystis_antarctica.AAC.2